jgi:HK97 family phage major capsid protein
MKSIAVLESETHGRVTAIKRDIAAIRQRAADEDRAETAAERAEIDRLIREGESAKHSLDRRRSDDAMTERIHALGGGSTIAGRLIGGARTLGATVMLTLGPWLQDTRASRPQRWESPSVEVPVDAALFATTLTSDPASGGDLIVPDYRPGIYPGVTRLLVVADLFATGQTDSNLISYMVEQSFVNAADTVLEGGDKPESTLTFDAASDPVRKIAHWLPVTEEMLEDVAQMRSYIDVRLRLGVQLAEEDQLLNGTVTAPDIVGIRNRTGLAADVAMGTDTPADAIAKQISAIQTATGLVPDGIVMHPANWLSILLAKTDTGEYVGDGPFARPVGPSLWGRPVALTTLMPSGVALVGCFKSAAQIFRKGGLRVAATNAHEDYFTKNLVAIRAEERLALAVYRPAAFGEVTGLT